MLRSSYRAVVAGLVLLPLLASAAPFTSPGDRDLIRDRQQRLLDEQRKRLEELQQLPGKGAPAAADASGDDERCFEIRRIELEGAGHLGESARRQLLA
ncbi:TPA: ShlB/FhaC/HecB family hemolysin secretion/activation protein, partial [Pseudomonas aeruginosa]|nr:ShlB/FhaC/HecB family hemolysin secretion/activation protein [Pseudomonas aeruginosa]HBN9815286.1 ShlB/FhaC/HecB family hemolysin secretion/activation protein [Pseudomonas aeruginosa]HCD6680509.1 ShlB/FhaC/HecB family hemolysin secretion/activation protein [Pseudomonas aeruginosa]HCD6684947.1 ShlB/FhaC/HecB family hemolysin secretion/activation protein [Pseudomonas aeruginosa]HCD7192207.1 ShlB/FhaC/HecB family hemolysin secretion/activation protein [Pseudomonas aeruginosa]